MTRRQLIAAALPVIAVVAVAGCRLFAEPNLRSPQFAQVLPLGAEEGVFAYSRISPDGRFLAYASEPRNSPPVPSGAQVINVVDLSSRQIVFSEPGIDPYWSNDGRRMIYLSFLGGARRVSLRNHLTGAITRDVAPDSLGDYYSWGERDGKDLILTIRSRFYPESCN
jgi:hypothetical protein